MVAAKKCKRCEMLNVKNAHFCENCGKKFGASGGGGGGVLVLVLFLAVIGGAILAYKMGYGLKDVQKVLAMLNAPPPQAPVQTPQQQVPAQRMTPTAPVPVPATVTPR